MTSGILKRSIAVAGHRTSISLEEPFWNALLDLAKADGVSVSALIARIDAVRGTQNLSSAIRVHVLERVRASTRPDEPESEAEAQSRPEA